MRQALLSLICDRLLDVRPIAARSQRKSSAHAHMQLSQQVLPLRDEAMLSCARLSVCPDEGPHLSRAQLSPLLQGPQSSLSGSLSGSTRQHLASCKARKAVCQSACQAAHHGTVPPHSGQLWKAQAASPCRHIQGSTLEVQPPCLTTLPAKTRAACWEWAHQHLFGCHRDTLDSVELVEQLGLVVEAQEAHRAHVMVQLLHTGFDVSLRQRLHTSAELHGITGLDWCSTDLQPICTSGRARPQNVC